MICWEKVKAETNSAETKKVFELAKGAETEEGFLKKEFFMNLPILAKYTR